MIEPMEIRGLPRSLQRDAWWMSVETPEPLAPIAEKTASGATDTPFPRWAGLLWLVVLADLLFWEKEAGLSLAVFALVLFFTAAFGVSPRRLVVGPSVLLVLSCLPVTEFSQPLSKAFLVFGFLISLVWAFNGSKTWRDLLEATTGFIAKWPDRFLQPLTAPFLMARSQGKPSGAVKDLLRQWAFPLGGVFLFASLMLNANPVLEKLVVSNLDLQTLFSRAFFWGGIALLIAPFLISEPTKLALPETPTGNWPKMLDAIGINSGSCLRALWLFNGVIGVQTAMDISIFLGGASLPEGMTYASYAHRGAYPLLGTALLAGAFALAARPFVTEHKMTKPLIYLWLAQNIALCLSALLRLDLYVDVYGLTYLRIYAMIWMGLVAVGLGLMIWQVARSETNLWLLGAWSGLAIITLYICSFVNFAEQIVQHNVALEKPDFGYICHLNPTARGALGHPDASIVSQSCPINQLNALDNWQEWGFRNWRSGLYDSSAQVMQERQQ
ncbi:DUF4173 domain-containing protein [Tropicibacter sp. R15_0]|uniref:DUF4153 domain-containing protein n=1 Tax=Tropicibacter sp. R15_0 TaxID=2821101 RepID=UPI001ADD0990|nr:DUF4173 domain-containing protein [Tropicibacter sp. R15_0]MBO9463933.1 DUF4173 domain-containing protein [Tropicibacter sp. R15_0]